MTKVFPTMAEEAFGIILTTNPPNQNFRQWFLEYFQVNAPFLNKFKNPRKTQVFWRKFPSIQNNKGLFFRDSTVSRNNSRIVCEIGASIALWRSVALFKRDQNDAFLN